MCLTHTLVQSCLRRSTLPPRHPGQGIVPFGESGHANGKLEDLYMKELDRKETYSAT